MSTFLPHGCLLQKLQSISTMVSSGKYPRVEGRWVGKVESIHRRTGWVGGWVGKSQSVLTIACSTSRPAHRAS